MVEPYCHGWSLANHEVLRGFQISGPSRSGVGHGWKVFRVDRMTELLVLQWEFVSDRDGALESHSDMTMVHCQATVAS